jgi:hypothetical protein
MNPWACSQKHDAVVRFSWPAPEFRRHVFVFRRRVTLFERHVGVSEGMFLRNSMTLAEFPSILPEIFSDQTVSPVDFTAAGSAFLDKRFFI